MDYKKMRNKNYMESAIKNYIIGAILGICFYMTASLTTMRSIEVKKITLTDTGALIELHSLFSNDTYYYEFEKGEM